MRGKGLVLIFSNRFEVLRNKVIQREEESESEVGKNRKMILKEKRVRKMVEV